ncbi:cytochrome c [Pseudomonas antarctica]|uniref:Cytochrome c n=1 Tax=Pseudomonas antarctica TaxID=219572 RepID=A0A1H0D364_9PSED|nr:c-type cytochrome [Pseudomonas antarctica]KAF2406311.1 cytochrome c2 [Pseudomonas antarctica]SDN64549.1 cytochrome c [Pseudomonas antarctica]
MITKTLRTVGASFALLLLTNAMVQADTDDVVRGQKAWLLNCGRCHQLDVNSVGPMHRGVVGRHAGSAEGFAYSEALRESDVIWTPANLNRWLTDPEQFIPGQAMGFSVENAQVRQDIIAYLATQKAP